jgi:very-short-patch-repair endonuclease/succinate dehydrogenase flavin-adding protein (antitoxin of CptAB toxin-antitoxin module)
MNLSKQVFAKQLRSNMTDAEKLLWYHLRGHRFQGVKFKRQQPLGNYIVDFVSFEKKVVVEVDGGQHFDSESDSQRDIWLQGQGFQVLRFWNNEVLGETESVLEKILQVLTSAPSPQPLSHKGRGVLTCTPSDKAEGVVNPQNCSLPPPGGGGLGITNDLAVVVGQPSQMASSSIRGGKNIERVRWRSRRGLLELDIILGRFIDASYMQLNEAELLAFEALLDMPDNPLWDMIADRQEATRDDHRALLEKIKLA